MTSKNKHREWLPQKQWNPFNSYKLLVHVERWRNIKRGKPIPPPVLITVDPTNVCNFNCIWCNAEYIRQHRHFSLSKKMLTEIADFLPKWSAEHFANYPLRAICIAGGGEPLLNPHTPEFIDRVVANGIEVGIVTNGYFINDCIDSLSQCTWVGVSIDAGTEETFKKLKQGNSQNITLSRVLDNIQLLVDYSNRHNKRLGAKHPSYGVSYKFLLHKENIHELYQAAKLAKEIGCKNIHYRPAGTTWDKIGTDKEIAFTKEDIDLFNEQILKAQELDDETFNVYGVTHKFNTQFERFNCFDRCYAIFMTAVISPPSSKDAPKDSFTMGLCCDRRGDEKLELLTNCTDVNEINKVWGGKRHWQIYDKIDVQKECPRCTYQPHNQIYEQVIINDSMTYKFI